MKIKKGCEVSTDDFWYDLTSGGNLKPEEMLEHQEDIVAVSAAIELILEFEESCEKQIPDFYR